MDVDASVNLAFSRTHLTKASSAALDQLDDTQLVLDGVDFQRLVGRLVDELDLTALVTEASETVRGLRTRGVDADRAVNRAVDRVLFPGGRQRSAAGEPPPTSDRTNSGAEKQ